MNSNELTRLQEESLMAYNRVRQEEAAPYVQAVALLEIAKQLQQANEQLETLTSKQWDVIEQLERIAGWLHAISDKHIS